jgi:DNA polymerase II small subunit/DNA polymerase delta subunit B
MHLRLQTLFVQSHWLKCNLCCRTDFQTGVYPFQDDDPLIIKDCPHVYFVGNQPRFESTVIEGPLGQQVRLIAVPKFQDTGEIVLLDMETLDVDSIQFDIITNND